MDNRTTRLQRQERAFRELLLHVWQHSAFYRDYYSSHGIRERDLPGLSVRDLPFTTKPMLMENFDAVVTDKGLRKQELEDWVSAQSAFRKIFYKDYVIQPTSGSTGFKGIFVYDSIALQVVNTAVADRLPGPENQRGKTKVACYFRATVGLLPPSVYDVSWVTTVGRPEHIVSQLNEFQPHRIIAFSSMAADLAQLALEGQLRIEPANVVVSGDRLTDSMEQTIRDAWNSSITVIYACSESVYVGIKREGHNEMHIVEDCVVLEILDHVDESVSPGEGGRAVLTNLYNTTFPVLRYELGDYLVRGGSATGSSVDAIRDIQGRMSDALPVRIDDNTLGEVHPVALSTFWVTGLESAQFVSLSPDRLRIDYVASSNLDEKVRSEFRSILASRGATGVQVEMRRVRHIDRDPTTGKFHLVRLVESEKINLSDAGNRGGSDKQKPPSRTPGIAALLDSPAAADPGAAAILAPGREVLGYGELREHVQGVVDRLEGMGIGIGDRVVVVLPQGPEMAVALMAVSACAVCVPLNPGYTAGEFDYFMADLNPRAVLIQQGIDTPARQAAAGRGISVIELHPRLDSPAGIFELHGDSFSEPGSGERPDAADIALILYTSGTTSRPKRVALTHRNITTSASNIARSLGLGARDRCLNIMPLFHIHGIVGGVFASISAGASVVAVPGFYAPRFFEWLGEFQPSWYTAVPAMHQAILARAGAQRDTISASRLRFIRSSSAPMPGRVLAELEGVFGTPVIESYGMTEASHMITSNPLPPGQRKPGSVGVAGGSEVRIRGEHGGFVGEGIRGEIVIRGAAVITGYDGEAQPDGFADGWLRTGDQGYIDGEGYLFITGRLKELVNRGGEKVAPLEVEEVLLGHPGVEEAVVFGMAHAELGEELGAAVVLRAGSVAGEEELQEFVGRELAGFKVPRRVVVVDAIPRGQTGKVERSGMAGRLGVSVAGTAGSSERAAYEAPRSGEEEVLAQIWSEVLGVERVGIHDDFFALGGDSILATLIVARYHEATGKELSFVEFFLNPTIARLSDRVLSANNAPELQPAPLPHYDNLPLSYAQQGLFLRRQLARRGPGLHRSTSRFALRGSLLSVAALDRSLGEIVKRHASLRAVFPTVNGEPRQTIVPATQVDATPLRVVDLGALRVQEPHTLALEVARAEARRPFDLSTGPLVRFTLIRVEPRSPRSLHRPGSHGERWMVHGCSSGPANWQRSTRPSRRGQSLHPLPDLPLQYTDFRSVAARPPGGPENNRAPGVLAGEARQRHPGLASAHRLPPAFGGDSPRGGRIREPRAGSL